MTNWLERAKLEMSKSCVRTTANSDERDVMAVMAVHNQDEYNNSSDSIGSFDGALYAISWEIKASNEARFPMTQEEELAILAWLAYIDETNQATIVEVLNICSANLN